jgi:putative ABC transport system permease protein
VRGVALGLAARALQAHRFRALLTLLSVSIGALGIVLSSSLAQSGFETLKHGLEEVGGAHLLLVVPKTPERAEQKALAYRRGLTVHDRDAVIDALPHVVEHSLFATLGTEDVLGDRGEVGRADLVAGDQHFLDAMQLPIARGRGFDTREHREHARVCVVGHAVAEELWRGADGLGRQLTIAGLHCRAVGVLERIARFGFSIGFDWDKLVVVPAETGADWFPNLRERSLLLIKTDQVRSNEAVERIVNARLVERHHGVDDFALIDFAALLRKFYAAFAILEVVAGCLAAVALFIGGIGIMNMLLISVSERVREIGIQKAIGASPAQVRAQFLCEAVLLSLAGGLGGVVVGIASSQLISLGLRRLVPSWVGSTAWGAVVVAFVGVCALGVLFGWLPARRAAGLLPVEALRR